MKHQMLCNMYLLYSSVRELRPRHRPTIGNVCLCSFLCKRTCNKVRKKEGSGQGWLVKTRVIYYTDKLKQVRPERLLGTSTLSSVVSVFTLSIRSGCLPDHRPCARVSTSLFPSSCSTVALLGLSTPITAIRHRCSSFCT